MTIRFACPACKSPVNAPDNAGGRKSKCPKCGAVLQIPIPQGELLAPPPQPVPTYAPAPPQGFAFDAPQVPYPAPQQAGYGGPPVSSTSRTVYIVLGLFLGGLGIHNFVAGRTGIGVTQLVLTIVSIPLLCVYIGIVTIWISWIWALVDIIAVRHDGQGRLMV